MIFQMEKVDNNGKIQPNMKAISQTVRKMVKEH